MCAAENEVNACHGLFVFPSLILDHPSGQAGQPRKLSCFACPCSSLSSYHRYTYPPVCADQFLPRSERGIVVVVVVEKIYKTIVTYNVWCSWMLQLRWMCVCRSQIAPLHLFCQLSAYLHAPDSRVDLLVFVPIPPPRSYVPDERRGRADESCLPLCFCSPPKISSMSRGCSMSIPRFPLQIQFVFFPRLPLRNSVLPTSFDRPRVLHASMKHDSRPPGCQLPKGWHAYLVRAVVWCTWCRC